MLEYYGNDTLCIHGGWLIDAGIVSQTNYKLLIFRNKMHRLQRGGNGRKALIEYASIPLRFRQLIEQKLGYDPTKRGKHQEFRRYLKIDKEAVSFFANYQTQTGQPLHIDRQREYHQNAMFLNALHSDYNNILGKRRAMAGRTSGIWENLTDVINDLRDEYRHTLPSNPVRLKSRHILYQNEGYTSLIHRGFGNNNSRKVNETLERLILSIYVMNNKPYPVMVRDIYLEFLAGKIDIVEKIDENGKPSGVLFQREDFYNEKGLPIVISEATIWNYINNPKNRAIVDSQRNDFHYYNNIHRPHHHRHRPEFSLSKLSLDDRDLPYGKFETAGKKIRVKAYYAYDVASGVLIGAAYSKKKDKELFISCMRDMFWFLKRNDLPFPLELEVEHHIVNKFADDLMKSGKVFPHVRWCNAGNSQEKRAEHLNRAKKYGYEKRYLEGIGRFTLTEANRPKQDKVWDDDGMHIKDKVFDFDDLVAMDRYTIDKFNNGLHPDQKQYHGMTRLQVLLENVNPNAVIFQDHIVAQYAGISTQTSIRRNQYVRVNYANYQLPDASLIERLQTNNYKVDACYLPGDGNVDRVHIFQNGLYLATCMKIDRYNEATAEQTDDDRKAFTEQSKYVAGFDGMIRKGRIEKTTKVEIISREDFSDMEVEVVETVEKEDNWEELGKADNSEYSQKAIKDF